VESGQVEVLGVQEFGDTARGIEALDAMVKAAPITILQVMTVTPARFVALITGDVASVEASLAAGRAVGRESLVDELLIQNLHPQVLPALAASGEEGEWDALGIIEAASITAGIEAGDCAAKKAEVRIVEIRADSHMGGRSSVKVIGPLGEVEAAIAAAEALVEARGRLVRRVIIPRPHPEIRPFYRASFGGRST